MAASRSGTAVRAAVLAVVLLVAGCGGVGSATPATPASSPTGVSSPAAVSPSPPTPLLATDDLDELLPGLSADASLRPRWETRDRLWELDLLRGSCGGDPASPSPTSSGAGSAEHEAEQWWQGTSPQYATLDVLRWPASEPRGPEAWVEDDVAAEAACPEALVLPDQPGVDGGAGVTAVVRRWEQPTTGGTPGNAPLPQWQVGGFAVDGSTGVAVRAGAYSAPSAQEAWALARPGVSALVARAAQRATNPAAAPSSSS